MPRFCERDNSATCTFHPWREIFLSGEERHKQGTRPEPLRSGRAFNWSADERNVTFDVRVGMHMSNSLAIAHARFQQAVLTGIKDTYKHDWPAEHVFTHDLPVKLAPWTFVDVDAVMPLVQYVGTVTMRLGHTTWTAPNVAVSVPWVGGAAADLTTRRPLPRNQSR